MFNILYNIALLYLLYYVLFTAGLGFIKTTKPDELNSWYFFKVLAKTSGWKNKLLGGCNACFSFWVANIIYIIVMLILGMYAYIPMFFFFGLSLYSKNVN